MMIFAFFSTIRFHKQWRNKGSSKGRYRTESLKKFLLRTLSSNFSNTDFSKFLLQERYANFNSRLAGSLPYLLQLALSLGSLSSHAKFLKGLKILYFYPGYNLIF
jgi:hypothetical protein